MKSSTIVPERSTFVQLGFGHVAWLLNCSSVGAGLVDSLGTSKQPFLDRRVDVTAGMVIGCVEAALGEDEDEGFFTFIPLVC